MYKLNTKKFGRLVKKYYITKLNWNSLLTLGSGERNDFNNKLGILDTSLFVFELYLIRSPKSPGYRLYS